MGKTAAVLLVDTLAAVGVRQVFGIVGDAINPFTDAIRRQKTIEWIGVRHEEGAALGSLESTIRSCLDVPSPAVLHAKVDPGELPVMPHFDNAQAVRFGIAKVTELIS